ncbi:hypothetical protein ASPCAL12211 [Aspergillus calidoustus]|uniref:Uncharacterized protein n=1 Tax=Aspergillus calidoustus TaxID=454130 RepID=A0A0U5GDD9_ASPCI|nr:hypothetical protein ASPCAL12211 [Aspergillus calidoustus]
MPHLPDLSKKEPSTKELLDKFKTRDSNIGESVASPESRLAEGMHYDRNKAPALQDMEKARSEKVDVEGGASRSVVDSIRTHNPSGVA